MALLSELVATCEAHRLDTQATLTVFARRLREAGRLSQAGRGRGAAHMTFLDAARFLIACAATDHPERAVDAEFEFSNMLLHLDRGDAEGLLTSKSAPTLDLALARFLEMMADGRIDQAERDRRDEAIPGIANHNIPVMPIVWLIVHRSGVQAQFRILNETYSYQHRSLVALARAAPGQDLTDRAADYAHATSRFRSGKNLRAELDERLFRAVANLIAGKAASE